MKYLFAFLLFNSFCSTAQNKEQAPSVTTYLNNLFDCFRTADQKKLLELYVKEQDLAQTVKERRHISKLSPADQKEFDSLIHIGYESLKQGIIADFNHSLAAGTKLKIKWYDCVIDSLKTDSIKNEYGNLEFSGKIFFRQKDNSKFYIMNFMNLERIDDFYAIDNLYTPYIHYGPGNRILTASIKKGYIKDCETMLTEFKNSMPNLDPKLFLGGKSISYHCECEYINQTNEADGVQRIKNRKYNMEVHVKKRK
jgi:hypothetical protein